MLPSPDVPKPIFGTRTPVRPISPIPFPPGGLRPTLGRSALAGQAPFDRTPARSKPLAGNGFATGRASVEIDRLEQRQRGVVLVEELERLPVDPPAHRLRQHPGELAFPGVERCGAGRPMRRLGREAELV